MAYDPVRREVVLFGGLNNEGNPLGDTWVWTGSAWQQRFPMFSPPARWGHSMAWDAPRRQIVLFSGSALVGGQPALDSDTWIWTGVTWELRVPATVPPPRMRAAMAYEASTSTVVLYGGTAPGTPFFPAHGDTWRWDGANWADATEGGAGKRENVEMDHDPVGGRLILFGGRQYGSCEIFCANAPIVGGTVSFGGGVWREESSAASPSARMQYALASDPFAGGVVIFGGHNPDTASVHQDTWVWQAGTGWQEAAGIASPPARYWPEVVFHEAAQHMVLFGGLSSAGQFGDTWTYSMGVPTVTKLAERLSAVRGQRINMTVTIGNVADVALLGVVLTDTLSNASFKVVTDSVVNAATGAPLCVGSVSCTVNFGLIVARGLSIPANGSIAIRYAVEAVGEDDKCSPTTNSARASSAGGTSSIAQTTVYACNLRLGFEKWWTTVGMSLGPQSDAAVNVDSGNLILQGLDSTPITGRGQMAYVLRRTYNSQAAVDGAGTGSRPEFAAGWTLNVASVDGDSLGMVTPAALDVALATGSALAAQPVQLIDRDGTYHSFRPKETNLALAPGSLPATLLVLSPKVLAPGAGGTVLCVDTLYESPAGVHSALWRYVSATPNASGGCDPSKYAQGAVSGYGMMRTDRVRSEFGADGRLLSLVDRAGVELRYRYDSSGRLTTVFEPRSCANPDNPALKCRLFSFAYPGADVVVTDPARRATRYVRSNDERPRLTSVVNPDGSTVVYAYGGCGNTTTMTLCSASDPRGATSSFAYAMSARGVLRVVSMTDRRQSLMTFQYLIGPRATVVDFGGRRRVYSGFDASGRVGGVDEGAIGGPVLRRTAFTWDVAAATCRLPDNVIDNNLCRRVQDSLTSTTASADTQFTYNPEGRLLVERHVNAGGDLVSTFGYRAQYTNASGAVTAFDDTPTGNGSVSAGGTGSTRAGDKTAVFALSDQTVSVPPRGNVSGANVADFRTTYTLDANTNVSPSRDPGQDVCTNPGVAVANTGLVCETTAPAFSGANATPTRHTYDRFGQRLTQTSAKAIVEGGAPTMYSYFADGAVDLGGAVSSAGWLQGVTDPHGSFVAFGYDAAGNVVRTWDRNATARRSLAQFPGTITAPPSGAFTDSFFGSVTAPWRYPTSSRNQLGNTTTFENDRNGNVVASRPPRGNQAGTAAFDITRGFDATDNLVTETMPVEAQVGAPPSRYTYDEWDNKLSVTDPAGHARTWIYDGINRVVETRWTRGGWPAGGVDVPASCRRSVAADTPIPVDRILCRTTTSYDGVDNAIASADGAGQLTVSTFDGVRREIRRGVARNDATYASTWTTTRYDANGNTTDVCLPRSHAGTPPDPLCDRPARFGVSTDFDVSDRPVTTTTYRGQANEPLTSRRTYDANGNQVSATDRNGRTATSQFDLLGRLITETVPRDASTSLVTVRRYDPAGNVLSITKPENRIAAFSYDAAHRLIDSVEGATSVDAATAFPTSVDGATNIRMRRFYDADGNVTRVLPPRSFEQVLVDNQPAQTFVFEGTSRTYAVPSGITSIKVDVRGAAGDLGCCAAIRPTPGYGGRVVATLPVTPGELLTIYVGGQGARNSGGFNGGGSTYFSVNGGAGGGASDVRRGSASLSDRLVVAAGGGGNGSGELQARAGDGGGLIGGGGANGEGGSSGGGGGTQSTGGAAGVNAASQFPSTAGSLGQGGSGGIGPGGYNYNYSGGGGGGGYHGGGGGGSGTGGPNYYDGSGGGGGSSYSSAGGATITAGFSSGHGLVVITPIVASVTTVFEHTGAAQSYVVPAGISTIDVDAYGAQGGGGAVGGSLYDSGGNGARVQARLQVTQGETLQVNVGAGGASSTGGGSGGFNGGGRGGANATHYTNYTSGGGGGASDIRRAGTGLANRVVTAGSGGGGTSSYGGAGGGFIGGIGGEQPGTLEGGRGGTHSACRRVLHRLRTVG